MQSASHESSYDLLHVALCVINPYSHLSPVTLMRMGSIFELFEVLILKVFCLLHLCKAKMAKYLNKL